MRLVTAILARNEAAPDRYLQRVLGRCAEFSDAVLVLDDNSEDDTAQIAREVGCVVERFVGAEGFWGKNEVPARRALWESAAHLAGDGWVLICDADMLLEGDPRPLCGTWEATAWAWPLVDLWDSEDTFRVDGPWAFGPQVPRPWLFRPSALRVPAIWPERAIHCGHAPQNWHEAGLTFAAPPDIFWKHLGWIKPEHRAKKYEAYMSRREHLTPFELAHAQSILDA